MSEQPAQEWLLDWEKKYDASQEMMHAARRTARSGPPMSLRLAIERMLDLEYRLAFLGADEWEVRDAARVRSLLRRLKRELEA